MIHKSLNGDILPGCQSTSPVPCCVMGKTDFSPESLPSGVEGNFKAAGHPGQAWNQSLSVSPSCQHTRNGFSQHPQVQQVCKQNPIYQGRVTPSITTCN